VSITTIAEAQSLVRSFVHERDWEVFHRPRSLAIAIAVEAAELLDELKWIADDGLQLNRDRIRQEARSRAVQAGHDPGHPVVVTALDLLMLTDPT
jgi:hypothetical protein